MSFAADTANDGVVAHDAIRKNKGALTVNGAASLVETVLPLAATRADRQCVPKGKAADVRGLQNTEDAAIGIGADSEAVRARADNDRWRANEQLAAGKRD